jgi:plasmid stability protein
MPDLLVRGVDDALVQALKKRAGAHGRSQEAELRAILAAALLSPPRRNLAELLAAMPDVGVDADFQRQDDQADRRHRPTARSHRGDAHHR